MALIDYTLVPMGRSGQCIGSVYTVRPGTVDGRRRRKSRTVGEGLRGPGVDTIVVGRVERVGTPGGRAPVTVTST